jgi:hypothetical protein
MPRGHRGTKRPKGWKPGTRVVIGAGSPPGSHIDLGPGEDFLLPVNATVIGIVFHSLSLGWCVEAKVDGTTRHSVFEMCEVSPLDPLTNFAEQANAL